MSGEQGTLLKLEQVYKQAAANYGRPAFELAAKKDELRLAYQELSRLQSVAADFRVKAEHALNDLHDAQARYKKAVKGSTEVNRALSDLTKAEDSYKRFSQQVLIYDKYVMSQRHTIKQLEQAVDRDEAKVEGLKRQLDDSFKELNAAKREV